MRPWPPRDGFLGRGFFGPHEFMSRPGHSERPPGRVGVRGSLKKPRIKNMTAPLYQHVLADSVAPRIKTLAADWQVWEFAEGATDIEYDGEYGSERVWIVRGRATIEPEDGSPSFNVGPGDVVYFLSGFQCTWRVHDAPLVQRYGFFGFDGKEIKDAEVTCDVCGCDCAEESYLYDDEMDICPRCFKLDAESAQQYEDAEHQRWGARV